MKITIRLVVSLVLVVTLVAGAFAYYQVRDERARLRSELEEDPPSWPESSRKP